MVFASTNELDLARYWFNQSTRGVFRQPEKLGTKSSGGGPWVGVGHSLLDKLPRSASFISRATARKQAIGQLTSSKSPMGKVELDTTKGPITLGEAERGGKQFKEMPLSRRLSRDENPASTTTSRSPPVINHFSGFDIGSELRNDFGAPGNPVDAERVLQFSGKLFRSRRQPVETRPES